jgi:hypothetical protein
MEIHLVNGKKVTMLSPNSKPNRNIIQNQGNMKMFSNRQNRRNVPPASLHAKKYFNKFFRDEE